MAKAIEQIANIGKRGEWHGEPALDRMPLFLVFKPDSDATLGIKLRKRIRGGGPFEVLEPRSDGPRYEGLDRAKGALLCRSKAARDWFAAELDALNIGMASIPQLDLRRALLLPAAEDLTGLDLLDDDAILYSDADLDAFLTKLQEAAA